MPDHPCGAVPVSTWSVLVWHCHEHQAYFAARTMYDETGSGNIKVRNAVEITWGPFDVVEDVLEQVAKWLCDLPEIATLPAGA